MRKWMSRLKEKPNSFSWKKKALLVSGIIIAGSVASAYVYENSFSYELVLNEEAIGIVREAEMVDNALLTVKGKVAEDHGEKAYYSEEVQYNKVRVKKDQLKTEEELVDDIYESIEIYKPAAIIVVDGEERLTLETVDQAEGILEGIKKPFNESFQDVENLELLDVEFNQKVEILEKDILVEDILGQEEALSQVNQTETKVYEVSAGDSAWTISQSTATSLEDLEAANPDKDLEKLKPGDIINLTVQESYIEVITTAKETTTHSIDFEEKKKKDSSIYTGETKVETEGEKGEKQITKSITYINGLKDSEEIIEEKVLKEPVHKVVLVGTKQRPAPVRRNTTSSVSRGSSASSRKPAPTYNGEKGAAIVATAKHYIGLPYVRGGSTPSGFDCSGFTSYVYRQYGISIPRTTGGQGRVGGHVSRSELRPGDLVIFPGHVGIYVGGDSFIHSPRTGKSIQISSLNGYWSSRFISGRRAY